MINLKILVVLAASLTHALTTQHLPIRRQTPNPQPYGDPGCLESGLVRIIASTKKCTQDALSYRRKTSNSTTFTNDLDDLWFEIRNTGDCAAGPHLLGPYNATDAAKVCDYIDRRNIRANRKFLAAVVAKKRAFARDGYNGTVIEYLGKLRDAWAQAMEYVDLASYGYDGNPAYDTCVGAKGEIERQYARAIGRMGG